MKKIYITRRALPDEAQYLTDLAHRSKAYWGYPSQWIAMWREDLTVTPEMIEGGITLVAEYDGKIHGYWFGFPHDNKGISVCHLFIEPKSIRTGCGEQLWKAMLQEYIQRGVKQFRFYSDPNSMAFYEKMGAKKIGEEESPVIPKRILPIMQCVL